MTERSDAELLAATDGAAFTEFVGRHLPAIARYATRRLGPDHADDIVNETFIAAFTRRVSYRPEGPDARAWLFGIATNLIRMHRRTEATQLRAYARRGVDPVAVDAPSANGVDAHLAAALAALRPQYRDVLFLHAVADLNHDQIAEALGVPVGTARGWLSRARQAAVKELEKRGVSTTGTNDTPNGEAVST